VEGANLVSHHAPFDVIRLPSSITNVEDACNYIYLNHTPDFGHTLATVAMNSYHACADGGFLRYIYEHCTDRAFAKRPAPTLPRALTDIWQAQIRRWAGEPSADGPDQLIRLILRTQPRDRNGNKKADVA
jgi:hypothetical protein